MACHAFEQRFGHSWDPRDWLAVPVVVGVSGGSDSVALARAMAAYWAAAPAAARQPLVLAHLNHRLRGAAADEDARFVEQLAGDLGLPLAIAAADVPALVQQAGDGIEAAARAARHAFFRQVAASYSARYVAVAHTRDDQVETVLHRIVRGTGLRGLAGIPRARGLNDSVTLIRPLLGFRREELRAYLAAIGQPFREDDSNQDARFTRNRIRHELLTLLRRDYNQCADEALLRLAVLSSEAQQLINQQLDALRRTTAVVAMPHGMSIDCQLLQQQPPLLVRELLRAAWQEQGWPEQSMGYAQWELLSQLVADASTAVITLPGGIRAEKKDGQLVLTRPSQE